jgi:lipopolysaccharide biosynthesis glycosyltransferase
MAEVQPIRMTVLSGSNAGYFPGLLVAFYSLLRNLAKQVSVDFVVLAEGLVEVHDATLRRVLDHAGREYSLKIIAVDLQAFEALRTDYGGSRMAYARLLMPQLIASDFALYVDSDIVVQRDVAQLSMLPWPDDCQLLYAVADPKGPTFANDGMNCERLGIPPAAPYFNSGWMWMNLGKWRQQDIAGKCADFTRRFPEEVKWWDQSVLNAVLWKNWQPLDAGWNTLVDHTLGRLDLFPFPLARNVNAHYLGPDKPWLAFNPYQQYFGSIFSEIAHLVPDNMVPYPINGKDVFKRARFFMRRSYLNYGSFCKQTLKQLIK